MLGSYKVIKIVVNETTLLLYYDLWSYSASFDALFIHLK